MRYLLAFLLLLTTSCASGTKFKSQPVPMYTHSFVIDHKNADIKASQVSFVMQFMSLYFKDPRVDEAFRHLTIIVTDEIEDKLDGFTVNSNIVYIRQTLITESIGKTAVAHELLHVALGAITGNTDHDHENKLWTEWLPKFNEDLTNKGL